MTLEDLTISGPVIQQENRTGEFDSDVEDRVSADETATTHSELCSEDLDTSLLDTSDATSASVDTSYYILDWRSDLTPGSVRNHDMSFSTRIPVFSFFVITLGIGCMKSRDAHCQTPIWYAHPFSSQVNFRGHGLIAITQSFKI